MNNNNNVNIVDEIKSRCNIVDVIGRAVPLKRAGSNYKGVCPFHNEKTPSFVVSESKQIFTCFGCGATGDVIEFVKRYNNLDFRGAVEMLAAEYGISLEGAFRSSRDRDELYEINRTAAVFFFRALRERANPGYTYMKQRGISEEILNRFGIGYADAGWDSLYRHLRSKNVSEQKMLSLGLISESKGRYFDKFRNRVIFPIMNTRGKVIGFGGRIIGDGEPKYLNSQESDVFRKKYNLYGLNLSGRDIRKADSIILVEGYMDVISLYQSGIRNVSASLGTALTENQAKLIKRYTGNVILSYDSDNAGQNAAFRGLDILYREGLRARVLEISEGKDPDEFVKQNGRGAFLELAENALPYGDFKLSMIKKGLDMDDEQQRIEYVRRAIDMLRSMKPVEADIYLKKISQETGISEGAVRYEYAGSTGGERGSFNERDAAGREVDKGSLQDTMPAAEQDLIKLMLTVNEYIHLPEDIRSDCFSSIPGKNIYQSLRDLYEDEGSADAERLRGLLEEEDAGCLDGIDRRIIPAGREQTIFDDCISRIRKSILKKQEKELVARLSLADENENHEEIITLTQQLIEIQKQIKN